MNEEIYAVQVAYMEGLARDFTMSGDNRMREGNPQAASFFYGQAAGVRVAIDRIEIIRTDRAS